MINTGSLPGSQAAPARAAGTLLLAAVDVEWSKNYRIRGGNVPFCYSVIWLALPRHGTDTSLGTGSFWYTSAYVHDAGETQDLAAGAAQALDNVVRRADPAAGGPLNNPLARLAAASHEPTPRVAR